MRKSFVFALIALLLVLVSCEIVTPNYPNLASITFRQMSHNSKSLEPSLSAYIEYTDPDTLLWDITMTKTDGKDSEGQGLYEDKLLTDVLDGFSLGSWNVSLVGHDDKDKTIYTGQMDIVLTEGLNNVEVAITPSGSKGSVCFVNCNFDGTEAILYCVMMDGTPLFSYPVGECVFNDNTGLYEVAETTQKVNAGIHNMQIQYGSHNKAFLLRIEPNMTTYVTYGIYEGKMGLSVVIEPQEAIVE